MAVFKSCVGHVCWEEGAQAPDPSWCTGGAPILHGCPKGYRSFAGKVEGDTQWVVHVSAGSVAGTEHWGGEGCTALTVVRASDNSQACPVCVAANEAEGGAS